MKTRALSCTLRNYYAPVWLSESEELTHPAQLLPHIRAWALVQVPVSHLLQVGLLYGTFPSGCLLVLVRDRSEIGLGLLNRLLLVGLLSRGREYGNAISHVQLCTHE